MTELSKITKKQQAILKLLYRFRFLNRIQIQAFLGHKDPKTINMWLRDLRAKGYVEWIYSTHFAEKTKPAIYYLNLNGVRYLRTLMIEREDEDSGEVIASPSYPPEELRKRYKEPTRSQTFIDRCILIANCALALEQDNDTNRTGGKNLRYYYETEADYLLDYSYYHFVAESETISPHFIFCKVLIDKDGKIEKTLESYIYEVFDPTLPQYRMKKRLGDYVKFLDEEVDEWQDETSTDRLPVILLVCPRTTDLIYAKRWTRGRIAAAWEWDDDDRERPRMQFTTMSSLQKHGLLGSYIWEQA